MFSSCALVFVHALDVHVEQRGQGRARRPSWSAPARPARPRLFAARSGGHRALQGDVVGSAPSDRGEQRDSGIRTSADRSEHGVKPRIGDAASAGSDAVGLVGDAAVDTARADRRTRCGASARYAAPIRRSPYVLPTKASVPMRRRRRPPVRRSATPPRAAYRWHDARGARSRGAAVDHVDDLHVAGSSRSIRGTGQISSASGSQRVVGVADGAAGDAPGLRPMAWMPSSSRRISSATTIAGWVSFSWMAHVGQVRQSGEPGGDGDATRSCSDARRKKIPGAAADSWPAGVSSLG